MFKHATVAPYTVLGWSVPNIKGRIRNLQKKGVTFERFGGFHQDELGVWTAPDGTKVAWFKDPEGNVSRSRSSTTGRWHRSERLYRVRLLWGWPLQRHLPAAGPKGRYPWGKVHGRRDSRIVEEVPHASVR